MGRGGVQTVLALVDFMSGLPNNILAFSNVRGSLVVSEINDFRDTLMDDLASNDFFPGNIQDVQATGSPGVFSRLQILFASAGERTNLVLDEDFVNHCQRARHLCPCLSICLPLVPCLALCSSYSLSLSLPVLLLRLFSVRHCHTSCAIRPACLWCLCSCMY